MTDPKNQDYDELEPLPDLQESHAAEELEARAEHVIEEVEMLEALEPLPEEAELEPLAPEPSPEPAPAPAPAPAPTKSARAEPTAAQPAVAPEPKPAPAPPASPTPQAAAPLKSGATTSNRPPAGAVKASSGSRRERMEKDREARKTKKKAPTWQRWEGEGEKPKREMEQAPLLLRKAAFWLIIGCILPWGGVPYVTSGEGDSAVTELLWWQTLVEKMLVAGGLYVWHQAHLLRDGAKVPGFITSLGKTSFAPLFVMAGVLALLGFAPLLTSASLSGDFLDNSGPFAEKGFLILAGLTLTHIYDYEHGGRFNPMLPIMFMAPAIAGIFALLRVMSRDMDIGVILGAAGGVLVTLAGSMAAYTMYVAMKEAKAHGEAKKAAMAEARKAARAAKRRP